MVDTLGAVLQGLNNGAATGLDMYKTMRAEERAKRAESLQLQRYAIDDARYEKSWERQVEQDRLAVERDERDHKWEKEKYAQEQKRLTEAAAATAAYRARQLQLQGANYSLKLSKHQREILKEQQGKHDTLVKDGLSVFGEAYKNDPDAAMDVYASNIYSRVGVNQQVARAQGFDLDAQTASELYAMPRPDGTYVIGRHTEKGFKAYDTNPDAEGEQALVMPADVFARTFAGTEGSQSLTAKNATASAQQEVAARAEQQYAGDNAQLLADAAGAEQAVAQAEGRLATLKDLPAYITSTDYRGQKITRFNPALAEQGIHNPQQLEAEKQSLTAKLQQGQATVDGLLLNQEKAKTSARETLSSGLNYLDQTLQGTKPADVPAAVGNTLAQLRADNGQVIQPGKTAAEATNANQERTKALYGTVSGIVDGAIPKGEKAKEFFTANSAKMKASLVAATENNGGLEQWLATPMGMAGVAEISAEMVDRNIDYGAGYLAKIMAMQGSGAQVSVGLDALQNEVIQSRPAQDREPIALLAAEIIGKETDDPEAAIMAAIQAYDKGERPKTPVNPQP